MSTKNSLIIDSYGSFLHYISSTLIFFVCCFLTQIPPERKEVPQAQWHFPAKSSLNWTKSLTWAHLLCLPAEKTQKGEKRKQNGVKEKGKERRKSSPEKKKERLKSENGSLLKELGTLCVCVCVGGCTPCSVCRVSKLIKRTSLAEHMPHMCVCLCVHMKDTADKSLQHIWSLINNLFEAAFWYTKGKNAIRKQARHYKSWKSQDNIVPFRPDEENMWKCCLK